MDLSRRAWLAAPVVPPAIARAGTPSDAVSRAGRDMAAAMAHPDVASRLVDLGLQVVTSAPERVAVLIRTETRRMAGALERAGLRAR